MVNEAVVMADSPARLNTEQKAKSDYSLVCEEKEDTSSNVTVRRSRTYLQNDVELEADVQTTIMQMLEKMNATLTKVNETCTGTQQSLQFTQSEVANLRISNENLKTENKVLTERIIKCESNERDLERRVDELTYFCATLDNADRKSNLLIEGAPETRGERPAELAATKFIFSKICPEISEDSLCGAYRVGPHDSNRRPILVTLMKGSQKQHILKNKGKLKGFADTNQIWINEDLNPVIRKKKTESRNIANLAKRSGRTAKLKGTGVVLDGVYYAHADFSRLPNGLKIASTKTRKLEKAVAFCGHRPVVKPARVQAIEIEGIEYTTVEHAYQCAKVRFAGDLNQAQKIIDTKDPYTAQKLGKAIHVPEWTPRREEVLKRLMKEKFIPNRQLQQYLLETGSDTLIECTVDPYWGSG